jgi:hypothetical protein
MRSAGCRGHAGKRQKEDAVRTILTTACLCALSLVPGLAALCAAEAPVGPAELPPLPEGDGLAAKYPGDLGIERAPAVVLADGFEDCAESADLRRKWNYLVWDVNDRLITEDPANVHGGKRAVEFLLRQGGEAGHGAIRQFPQGYDALFVRYYLKFHKEDDFYNSAHDGVNIVALAPGFPPERPFTAGTRADGRNKFMASLDTWRTRRMTPVPHAPGELIVYCYHPEQRGGYGDNFYPRERFPVERDRWYCCELMVKANTVGQRDGRVAYWVDGKLVGDFPGLRLRDVDTLKINFMSIGFYIGNNRIRDNAIWYDDLVAATSYIGPMKPPDAQEAPEQAAGKAAGAAEAGTAPP